MKMTSDVSGYVAFLLHAHLPYVKSNDPETSFEEKWLFEAITESYIPLIMSWERLWSEGVDFHLTLSLSPTLISMLVDPDLTQRYGQYLTKQLELAEKELKRNKKDSSFKTVVDFYYHRFSQIDRFFKEKSLGDLIKPIADLAKNGCLELITTCATHGFLPLFLTDEARKVQIKAGIQTFEKAFGWKPKGLWLPECGYTPGIEKLLKEEEIVYFIMAGHGFLGSIPKAASGVYTPVKCANGVNVFGRDYETSQQVWSRSEGYPGDYDYREFYRDIGYDLDYEYVHPYLPAGIRGDTGFKYYRITGKSNEKEIYSAEIACLRAKDHAWDFVQKRNLQVANICKQTNSMPVITAPYDAELFGHWWFEGPDWLENVLRISSSSENPIRTIGFSNYLKQFPPQETVSFGPSSWGEGGFNRYWLNEQNDWTYPYIHVAEKTMIQLADSDTQADLVEKRALNQAGRELLLAQSSDWPFIMTSQTVVEYANQRFKKHLANFFKICQGYQGKSLDEKFITDLENESPLFTDLKYQYYQSNQSHLKIPSRNHPEKPTIIMLSWEYPPQYIGGLGIHVRDLSEALSSQGNQVHVLTVAHDGEYGLTSRNGVAVHSLPAYQKLDQEIDFISWIMQINLKMADYGRELLRFPKNSPAVIHAHDWLVASAALELQQILDFPLVSTIHATESGRNNGLYNSLQQSIHLLEKQLISNSDQLICCSQYMKKEVTRLFNTHSDINVIPNAVKPIVITHSKNPKPKGKTILFFGRLVPEKGVQHLLEAVAGLIHLYPDLCLNIAGSGPYLNELQNMSQEKGIADRVQFLGFVPEKERNQLLAKADVTVFPSLYEPFGLVALEAMSAGVPVIVSNTGGLAETVKDGINGLKFTPGNVGELQGCLVKILQNKEVATELKRHGKEMVNREYTWDAVAVKTAQIYAKELTGLKINVS